MKFILCLILVMLFTVMPCLAQDDSGEWVTVKKSQLMAWRDHILHLQSMVDKYSANITMLELEIMRLQDESLKWQKAYENEKRGWFVGANAGYPFLSADFIVLYKFNRFGIYSMVGYNTAFTINLGFLVRISK